MTTAYIMFSFIQYLIKNTVYENKNVLVIKIKRICLNVIEIMKPVKGKMSFCVNDHEYRL